MQGVDYGKMGIQHCTVWGEVTNELHYNLQDVYKRQWRCWTDFRCPLPATNVVSFKCQISTYFDAASFRYSGEYSVLIRNFIPVYWSSRLISWNREVIFSNRRYLDFSVAFFHTQEYLFALASNLEPSIYKCCRSVCSFSKIFWLISQNSFSIESLSISLIKYQKVR